MIVTKEYIKEKFLEYREKYFKGMQPLPIPDFFVIHNYKYGGLFEWAYPGPRALLKKKAIGISDYWDYTEEQFRDILVHEMIHYYLAYNRIDRSDRTGGGHGEAWKKMAEEFNEKYGLHITEKIDVTNTKRNKAKSILKYCWFNLFG